MDRPLRIELEGALYHVTVPLIARIQKLENHKIK
jgi:hypothetical protein